MAALSVLGVRRLTSLRDLVCALAPVLFVMACSYGGAHFAKDAYARRRRRQLFQSSHGIAEGSSFRRMGSCAPLAECKAFSVRCWRVLAGSVVCCALFWPSLFGLLYLLITAVAILVTSNYASTRHLLENLTTYNYVLSDVLLYILGALCMAQYVAIYAAQIHLHDPMGGKEGEGGDGGGGGPEEAVRCVMELVPARWRRLLGVFCVFTSGCGGCDAASSGALAASLQVAQILSFTVTLVLLGNMAPLTPCCGKILEAFEAVAMDGAISQGQGGSSFHGGRGVGGLREPLLSHQSSASSSRRGSSGSLMSLLRSRIQSAVEAVTKSRLKSVVWMLTVNLCACLVMLWDPSVLSITILAMALANVYAIQHATIAPAMNAANKYACAFLLLVSYLGDISGCSEGWSLVFVGSICHARNTTKVLLILAQLTLVFLYESCCYFFPLQIANGGLYANERRGSWGDGGACSQGGGQGPGQGADAGQGQGCPWSWCSEIALAAKLVTAGAFWGAYVGLMFWIACPRINALNALFGVILLGHLLTGRNGLWLKAGQMLAMLTLVAVMATDRLLTCLAWMNPAFVDQRLLMLLDKLGLTSVDILRDLAPKLGLIVLNLIVDLSARWFQGLQSRESHRTPFHNPSDYASNDASPSPLAWRLFLHLARGVRRVFPYVTSCVLFGVVMFRSDTCFSKRHDLVGLLYLCGTYLIIVTCQVALGSTSRGMWLVVQAFAVCDAALQFACFSSVFGFAHYSAFVKYILQENVGCVASDVQWECFALSVLRPLVVLLLIKIYFSAKGLLSQQDHGEGEGEGRKSTLGRWARRMAVLHASKGVALASMATASVFYGVAGMTILLVILAYGITPQRREVKPSFAYVVQIMAVALLSAEYVLRVGMVEKRIEPIIPQLRWFGLYLPRDEGGESASCIALLTTIMACHLQILASNWEPAASPAFVDTAHQSQDQEQSSCLLFMPLASLLKLVESGDGDCPAHSHFHSHGTAALLDGSAGESHIGDADLNERPKAPPPGLGLSRSNESFPDPESHESISEEDSCNNYARVAAPPVPNPSNDGHRLLRQIACICAFIRFHTDYWGADKWLMINVLCLLVSAVVCLNVFSIAYLLQIPLLMSMSGRRVTPQVQAWILLPVNIAILIYAYFANLMLLNPWWADDKACADPKAASKEFWLGMCVTADVLWSCFFCAWSAIAYVRVLYHAPSLKEDVARIEAIFMGKVGTLFFRDTVSDAEYSHGPGDTMLEAVGRFVIVHSLDITLALIVLIAFINIDIFHLGYFGIALFYMRCRDQFWKGKSRLWIAIMVYNFLVILAITLYQGPWQALLGFRIVDGEEACSAQHLLGIYKITSIFAQAFKMQSSDGGLMFDCLMFLAVNVQYLIFQSQAFYWLMSMMQKQRMQMTLDFEHKNRAWREQQVMNALRARQQKQTRLNRVEWLKKGLKHSQHGSVDANLDKLNIFDSIRGGSAREISQVIHRNPSDPSPALQGLALLNLSDAEEEEAGRRGSLDGSNDYQFCDCDDETNATFHETVLERINVMLGTLRDTIDQRRDTDSYLVYALLVLNFASEFSFMTLSFPIVVFGYALLSPGLKSQLFWRLLLCYVEVCLTLKYCFWIPFEHACPGFEQMTFNAIDRSSRYWLLMVGIQPKPFPTSIPLIALYLALIWHYDAVLNVLHVQEQGEPEAGIAPRSKGFALERGPLHVWRFLRNICGNNERAPYIMHLSLNRPEDGVPWRERPVEDVQACLDFFYRQRLHPEVSAALPADIEQRLRDVSVNFSVETVTTEAATERETETGRERGDESVEGEGDVAIVAIQDIKTASSVWIENPASDISVLLKAVSHAMKTNPNLAQSVREIYPESPISAFDIADADALCREERDYYVLIFAADVAAFLFAVLFYQQMVSSRSKSLTNSFSLESVFPADFIYAIIVLFLLIIIDRAIYVLGSNLYKVLYHFATLAFFLSYLMCQYWSVGVRMTRTSEWKHLALEIFFCIKSLGLAFSSRQLRTGFPANTAGHFLMRKHTTLNSIMYGAYSNIPFLPELRALLDWTCTATTLEFFDWMRVEEVRSSLFMAEMRNMYRRLEGSGTGTKMRWSKKFSNGVLLIAGLIVLLFGPLLLYSSNNPAVATPALIHASVNVTLLQGRMYFPIFQSAEDPVVHRWKRRFEFFGNEYKPDQVQHISLSPSSDAFWSVTPPRRRDFQSMLTRPNLELQIVFSLKRSIPTSAQTCSFSITRVLSEGTRQDLIRVLKGEAKDTVLRVLPHPLYPADDGEGIYNLLLQIKGGLQVCEVSNHFQPNILNTNNADVPVVGCSLGLKRDASRGEWWNLECTSHEAGKGPSRQAPQTRENHPPRGPLAVLVLEETIGQALGALFASKGGLIGVYLSFVLVLGRFLKLSYTNQRTKILFDELPSTESLRCILEDIDAARAERELAVEEELYWGLIRIYRTPAILYELSKKKN